MIDGKQHLANKKKAAAQRLIRTEAYAEKVRTLFVKTVNEILALNKTMPTLEDGVMYSFDGDSIKKQKEVEALLRRLSSTVTLAVQNGIKLEWEAANKECDQFVASVFGKKVLSTPEFTAYMDRNTAARDAFIGRTENGLDLSKRVWKSVKQLREEMEVAMTVAIGEGDSASSMSRKVREYLNDPDLMFRRFRYKKGEKDVIDPTTGEIVGTEPIYGKKWKKRIKDEKTGKYKWIDYDRDTYKSGTGVYKSSARNAMRVTRTETNIAYRRADHERWQQMDFVLGQRVQLSKNHPKKDICDKLQGDYPKDFVFDGWHPQCFCFVTPILMDADEMAKVTEAFLNGETYEPKGKQITEYPTAFKDWVREHSTDIAKARERGTEPYFIRNNQMAIDEIINPSAKKKTALEIAEERHAARTSEQEDAIRLRAANRQKAISAGKRYLDEFEGVDNVDTSALREAYEHGRWEDVRSEALKLAQKKRSVLEYSIEKMNEAKDYGEIDITALQSALKSGKFAQMQNEAMAMQKLINQTKAAENAISDLIPEAHEWHKQFSMAELQQTHAAVQKKLNDISGLPLAEQKKKLEMEIKYVEDPTYLKPHTQYPTWKVSQDAYIKKLNEVVVKIEIEAVEQQLAVVKAWSVNHPKSLNVANLLAEAQSAIANSEDITIIKQKANLAIAEHQKRLAEQARRDAKNVGKVSKDVTLLQTDKDAYSQKRKDAAIWCKSSRESDDLWGDESDDLWNSLTPEQQKAWYDYTAGSGHMNRPLRGYSGGWGWGHYKGVGNVPLDNEGGEANIRNLKGVLDTTISTQDKWLQRGIETWSGVEGFIGVRNLTREQLRGMVGRIVTDYSFMSCGSAKGTGFSGTILNIYCPKGSKTFYAKRHSAYKSENETFMQIGATYRIIKVEAPDYGNVYIDIELIGYKEHPLL